MSHTTVQSSPSRRLHGYWTQWLERLDKTELAAAVTLVFVLHSASIDIVWYVRATLYVLVSAGLVFRSLLTNGAYWLGVTGVLVLGIWSHWYLKDNHAFLAAYWCLALGLAFATSRSRELLAFNGRVLIGLCFLFAVIVKVVSPDFTSGTFFHHALLHDPRMLATVRVATDVSTSVLADARDVLAAHLTLGELASGSAVPDVQPFSWLSGVLTWWVLAIESLVAVFFLVPARVFPLARYRDVVLLVFVFSTYVVIPVIYFGWLLIAMGLAQADERGERYTVPVYAGAFVLLLIVRHFLLPAVALL